MGSRLGRGPNQPAFTSFKQGMELHKASELRSLNDAFKVISHTEKSQVAMMTILPDQESGEYGNEHSGSDQVMVVVDGRGHAVVGGEEVELEEGDVLHIQAGEAHQIKADGAVALRTLNFYAPKAYPDDTDEKQEGIETADSFPTAT
jgi:mannose-6-phosphate isomerase-like protein (cupin superfamily)